MIFSLYKITNKINNKSYIGQTNNFKERINEHFRVSKRIKSREYNTPFHRAIRKYGKNNFIVEELYRVKTRNQVNKLERKIIKKNNTLLPYGYNISPGGDGYNPSKETRRKIGEASKLMWSQPGFREKMSKIQKETPNHFSRGKHLSLGHKNKISKSVKKSMWIPEIRQKQLHGILMR